MKKNTFRVVPDISYGDAVEREKCKEWKKEKRPLRLVRVTIQIAGEYVLNCRVPAATVPPLWECMGREACL